MTITKLTTHDDCEMSIRRTINSGPHYAELRCVPCNKHIQWLNKATFFCLVSGTDINNNNNNINYKNNVIISVNGADDDNDQVLRTSVGLSKRRAPLSNEKVVMERRQEDLR